MKMVIFMQQYFIKGLLETGQIVTLDEQQSFHIVKVMRMKESDVIVLADDAHKVYEAELVKLGSIVEANVLSQLERNTEMDVQVTVIMALIKKDKWDFFLMKATELGAARFVPYKAKRSVVKSDDEKIDKKKQRWMRIAEEAAEQSRRQCIPEITDPAGLKEIKKYMSEVNLIAYEKESGSGKLIRDVMHSAQSVTIVIGPEGGFDPKEVDELLDMGFECVSLGKRILRAETAACYALAAIDALVE